MRARRVVHESRNTESVVVLGTERIFKGEYQTGHEDIENVPKGGTTIGVTQLTGRTEQEKKTKILTRRREERVASFVPHSNDEATKTI